jgi:hypothetical protein
VGEDLLDHRRVFDAGNDPQHPAAGRTDLDVEAENAFQVQRPLRLALALGGRRLHAAQQTNSEPGMNGSSGSSADIFFWLFSGVAM